MKGRGELEPLLELKRPRELVPILDMEERHRLASLVEQGGGGEDLVTF